MNRSRTPPKNLTLYSEERMYSNHVSSKLLCNLYENFSQILKLPLMALKCQKPLTELKESKSYFLK